MWELESNGRFQAVGVGGHQVGSRGAGRSQGGGPRARAKPQVGMSEPAQRHPGLGRTRAGWLGEKEQRPRLRPLPTRPRVAGPAPACAPYLGRGALLRRWRLRQAPRGREKRRRPPPGQAPRNPGSAARGRCALRSGGCFQERAVPTPRSLRPAPRWAGRAEPGPCRRAGSLVPRGLRRDDRSAPAVPSRLPAVETTPPPSAYPSQPTRGAGGTQRRGLWPHPRLLSSERLPTAAGLLRYQEPAGRYWADCLIYMYIYTILCICTHI